MVHANGIRSSGPPQPVIGSKEGSHPITFEKEFLAQVDEYKLHAIQQMVYCPLACRSSYECLQRLSSFPHSKCDEGGVQHLRRIVQTCPVLSRNLKTLILFLLPKCPRPSYQCVLSGRGFETPADKWDVMGLTKSWQALLDDLAQDGPDACWQGKRAIGFEGFRFEPGGGVYHWTAVSWRLVCKRLSSVVRENEDERVQR